MSGKKKDVSKRETAPKKRGPKAEILKLDGQWADAVKHALGRGKPPSRPAKKR